MNAVTTPKKRQTHHWKAIAKAAERLAGERLTDLDRVTAERDKARDDLHEAHGVNDRDYADHQKTRRTLKRAFIAIIVEAALLSILLAR